MEKVEAIVNLIIAICSLIPTLVSIVLLVKNIIKTKNWKLIEQMALSAMSSVEEYAKAHPDMTGQDKLDMAVQAVKSGLATAGINFDEQLIKDIEKYIGSMCSWSKTVNN